MATGRRNFEGIKLHNQFRISNLEADSKNITKQNEHHGPGLVHGYT